MTGHRLSLLAVALLSATLHAQDASWPAFRGPHQSGVAEKADPPLTWSDTENLKWKVALPGPGSSSPIVVGDRLFVTCYTGYGAYLEGNGDPKKLVHHLVCLERASGKILWDRAIPGPLDKPARAIQLKEHGFASPTPVSDGEVVYAYLGRAGVAAIDGEGKVLWQAELGTPSKDAPPATNSVKRGGRVIPLRWGSAASPLLEGDLVIVNASEESNSIRAFDRKTGELRWKRESANLEGSAISPTVVGPPEARVLVIVLAGEVWGLAPGTGELIWRVETDTSTGMVPTAVADAHRIYTFGGDGHSYALRYAAKVGTDDGTPTEEAPSRIVWSGENLGVPSPTLHDGRLFLVRSNGVALCLKAEDGEVLHKGKLKGPTGQIYASPLLAGGRLYVVSRRNGTLVYSADGAFELLARNQLDDDSQFNASPAVAKNELYLRSDKHLYCLAGS